MTETYTCKHIHTEIPQVCDVSDCPYCLFESCHNFCLDCRKMVCLKCFRSDDVLTERRAKILVMMRLGVLTENEVLD
jgi:hypothetical protein